MPPPQSGVDAGDDEEQESGGRVLALGANVKPLRISRDGRML
jgi:hypothetical protein